MAGLEADGITLYLLHAPGADARHPGQTYMKLPSVTKKRLI